MKPILVLTLLLVFSTVAWAGEDNLKQAEQFFEETRFDRALAAVDRVLGSADVGPEQMVEAYRLKGLCLSALGRVDAAVMAFRRLLAIDPDFRLSRDISPKLAPPFYKALAMERRPISLTHNQPNTVKSLAGQELKVVLEDDTFGMVNGVRLVFWGEDGNQNKVEASLKGPGAVLLTLPAELKDAKVSYYFEATTVPGGVVHRLGTKEKPFDLLVQGAQVGLVLNRPPSGNEAFSTTNLTANENMVASSQSEKKSAKRPFYKTWWFWTAVGVAVAGAATGATIAILNGQTSNSNYKDYTLVIK
jgi:hypothetical protein